VHSTPLRPEVPIRALSISLVAVAAIVASVLVARLRTDPRHAPIPGDGGEDVVLRIDLESIRAAGL
jgi:hypothetical protein